MTPTNVLRAWERRTPHDLPVRRAVPARSAPTNDAAWVVPRVVPRVAARVAARVAVEVAVVAPAVVAVRLALRVAVMAAARPANRHTAGFATSGQPFRRFLNHCLEQSASRVGADQPAVRRRGPFHGS